MPDIQSRLMCWTLGAQLFDFDEQCTINGGTAFNKEPGDVSHGANVFESEGQVRDSHVSII